MRSVGGRACALAAATKNRPAGRPVGRFIYGSLSAPPSMDLLLRFDRLSSDPGTRGGWLARISPRIINAPYRVETVVALRRCSSTIRRRIRSPFSEREAFGGGSEIVARGCTLIARAVRSGAVELRAYITTPCTYPWPPWKADGFRSFPERGERERSIRAGDLRNGARCAETGSPRIRDGRGYIGREAC